MIFPEAPARYGQRRETGGLAPEASPAEDFRRLAPLTWEALDDAAAPVPAEWSVDGEASREDDRWVISFALAGNQLHAAGQDGTELRPLLPAGDQAEDLAGDRTAHQTEHHKAHQTGHQTGHRAGNMASAPASSAPGAADGSHAGQRGHMAGSRTADSKGTDGNPAHGGAVVATTSQRGSTHSVEAARQGSGHESSQAADATRLAPDAVAGNASASVPGEAIGAQHAMQPGQTTAAAAASPPGLQVAGQTPSAQAPGEDGGSGKSAPSATATSAQVATTDGTVESHPAEISASGRIGDSAHGADGVVTGQSGAQPAAMFATDQNGTVATASGADAMAVAASSEHGSLRSGHDATGSDETASSALTAPAASAPPVSAGVATGTADGIAARGAARGDASPAVTPGKSLDAAGSTASGADAMAVAASSEHDSLRSGHDATGSDKTASSALTAPAASASRVSAEAAAGTTDGIAPRGAARNDVPPAVRPETPLDAAGSTAGGADAMAVAASSEHGSLRSGSEVAGSDGTASSALTVPAASGSPASAGAAAGAADGIAARGAARGDVPPLVSPETPLDAAGSTAGGADAMAVAASSEHGSLRSEHDATGSDETASPALTASAGFAQPVSGAASETRAADAGMAPGTAADGVRPSTVSDVPLNATGAAAGGSAAITAAPSLSHGNARNENVAGGSDSAAAPSPVVPAAAAQPMSDGVSTTRGDGTEAMLIATPAAQGMAGKAAAQVAGPNASVGQLSDHDQVTALGQPALGTGASAGDGSVVSVADGNRTQPSAGLAGEGLSVPVRSGKVSDAQSGMEPEAANAAGRSRAASDVAPLERDSGSLLSPALTQNGRSAAGTADAAGKPATPVDAPGAENPAEVIGTQQPGTHDAALLAGAATQADAHVWAGSETAPEYAGADQLYEGAQLRALPVLPNDRVAPLTPVPPVGPPGGTRPGRDRNSPPAPATDVPPVQRQATGTPQASADSAMSPSPLSLTTPDVSTDGGLSAITVGTGGVARSEDLADLTAPYGAVLPAGPVASNTLTGSAPPAPDAATGVAPMPHSVNAGSGDIISAATEESADRVSVPGVPAASSIDIVPRPVAEASAAGISGPDRPAQAMPFSGNGNASRPPMQLSAITGSSIPSAAASPASDQVSIPPVPPVLQPFRDSDVTVSPAAAPSLPDHGMSRAFVPAEGVIAVAITPSASAASVPTASSGNQPGTVSSNAPDHPLLRIDDAVRHAAVEPRLQPAVSAVTSTAAPSNAVLQADAGTAGTTLRNRPGVGPGDQTDLADAVSPSPANAAEGPKDTVSALSQPALGVERPSGMTVSQSDALPLMPPSMQAAVGVQAEMPAREALADDFASSRSVPMPARVAHDTSVGQQTPSLVSQSMALQGPAVHGPRNLRLAALDTGDGDADSGVSEQKLLADTTVQSSQSQPSPQEAVSLVPAAQAVKTAKQAVRQGSGSSGVRVTIGKVTVRKPEVRVGRVARRPGPAMSLPEYIKWRREQS